MHDRNFWMGLERIHILTNNAPYRLRLEFQLVDGSWYSVEYNRFQVENEANFYRILVSGYSGDSGDVMNSGCGEGVANGMNFTTFDRDNDRKDYNCAQVYGGGWWHNACFCLNLNRFHGNVYGVVMGGSWHSFSTTRMPMKTIN